MADEVERLLDSAVNALAAGNASSCISLASQAMSLMDRSDRRYPEALSLRGSARLRSELSLALSDLQLAVELDPEEPQFLAGLGQGLFLSGAAVKAVPHLEKAFRLSRGNLSVASQLARVYLTTGQAFRAVQLLGPLLERGRSNKPLAKLYGEALYASGDVFTARDVLTSAIRKNERTPEDLLQLARLDMALRDYPAAEAHLLECLKLAPDSVPALCSAVRLMDWTDDRIGLHGFLRRLTSLAGETPEALSLFLDHAETVSSDILHRAERLAGDSTRFGEDVAALGFSLALYFDRTQQFDRAFRMAAQTNEKLAVFRNAVQTPEAIQTEVSRFRRMIDSGINFFRTCKSAEGNEQHRFVYLVGAPRSGSSLIQSVLAAGEGVVSVGERGALYPYLADSCEKMIEPAAFERLAADLQRAELSGLERQGQLARIVVDKTPHHLFVAGGLSLVHGATRFVQVFRDAGDVALSMFLRPFSGYFPEATSLAALEAHLAFRCEAFRRWQDAGLKIVPFSYDAFAGDPSREGQRLFGLLDLDWDHRYLSPENRPQAVPTFSSRQVRKAITARPSPHWTNYEPFAPEAFARLSDVTTGQNLIAETKLL